MLVVGFDVGHASRPDASERGSKNCGGHLDVHRRRFYCLLYSRGNIVTDPPAAARRYQGAQDLPGKRVATVTGSTSSEYLKHHGIPAKEFTRVEDACEALQQASVDAVVYDAPVLLYYASHEGKGKVQIVGPLFRKESYGILFPSNSSKRKLVNETLLKLKENGTYDRLYTKWFGGNGS
jgi:ABC-type amino acid transport substrate-binding protein